MVILINKTSCYIVSKPNTPNACGKRMQSPYFAFKGLTPLNNRLYNRPEIYLY